MMWRSTGVGLCFLLSLLMTLEWKIELNPPKNALFTCSRINAQVSKTMWRSSDSSPKATWSFSSSSSENALSSYFWNKVIHSVTTAQTGWHQVPHSPHYHSYWADRETGHDNNYYQMRVLRIQANSILSPGFRISGLRLYWRRIQNRFLISVVHMPPYSRNRRNYSRSVHPGLKS